MTQPRDRRFATWFLMVLLGAVAAACSVAELPASPPPTVPAIGIPAPSPSRSAMPLTATPTPEPAGPTPTWDPSAPPIDPELYAMLPAEVRGVAMLRYVVPATVFVGGGDVCSIICPNEPEEFAAKLHVARAVMSVGFAYAKVRADARFVIIAYRVQGLEPGAFLEARLALYEDYGGTWFVQSLKANGKNVTRIYAQPFRAEYLYVHADTVFMLLGEDYQQPEDIGTFTENEPIPEDVLAAIEALP